MKKKSIIYIFSAIALISGLFSLSGCSADPGVGNYYTSTKEYATDYLQNRERQFSDYLKILDRATGERGDLRLVDLLGTYGSYTVFAPTNDAIHTYLLSRGLTSVDELSKEDCDTIALNSIIEQAYFTTDYSNATYPKGNMLEHVMSISCDTLGDNGNLRILINKQALLTHADDSVCNGVVHTVAEVVSTSNLLLSSMIEEDSTISIYNSVLDATSIRDTLSKYVDESYGFASNQDRIDSCSWTNDKLCIFTAAEYDNVAYPEKRYYNYTAFMVQDEVLAKKYGVTKPFGKDDPSSLEYLAHQLYDPVYPEDQNDDNLKSRKNALNRFISYHILDRYGDYYTLTANDNVRIFNNFNRKKHDISDWYQTLMPHSLMKFSFPNGTQAGLYINRRAIQSRPDEQGVFVRGSKVADVAHGPQNANGINGLYHYIDDIVAYDKNTQQVVLNERLRFDCSTLSPDFMTKLTDSDMARGHKTTYTEENNGTYGKQCTAAGNARNNGNHCIGFKAGYVRNFKYTDNTHLHVRNRYLDFWSYEGDEVTIKGAFDVEITLPPVPEGTYEVRMFTCTGFSSRGILQAYINGNAQGIPFDMRPGGANLFGFQDDKTLGDDDAIAAFDKAIHNIGWMKGPDCYQSGHRDSFNSGDNTFRQQANTIRRILGSFYTDGKSDVILRLQQKMESGGEMNFDFLEICPSSVYNNEYYTETKW